LTHWFDAEGVAAPKNPIVGNFTTGYARYLVV